MKKCKNLLKKLLLLEKFNSRQFVEDFSREYSDYLEYSREIIKIMLTFKKEDIIFMYLAESLDFYNNVKGEISIEEIKSHINHIKENIDEK